MSKYILTIDAGTTSERAIIFDKSGQIVGVSQKEFQQFFPKPGWVEHDAEEIWTTQKNTIINVLKKHEIKASDIEAIGITNQRETTIVWNKKNWKTYSQSPRLARPKNCRLLRNIKIKRPRILNSTKNRFYLSMLIFQLPK